MDSGQFKQKRSFIKRALLGGVKNRFRFTQPETKIKIMLWNWSGKKNSALEH